MLTVNLTSSFWQRCRWGSTKSVATDGGFKKLSTIQSSALRAILGFCLLNTKTITKKEPLSTIFFPSYSFRCILRSGISGDGIKAGEHPLPLAHILTLHCLKSLGEEAGYLITEPMRPIAWFYYSKVSVIVMRRSAASKRPVFTSALPSAGSFFLPFSFSPSVWAINFLFFPPALMWGP